jgi:hypothetical protein
MHRDEQEILASLYTSLRGAVRVGITNKRIRVLSKIPVNVRLVTIMLQLTCSYKTKTNHYIYFYDKNNKWLILANKTTQKQFVRKAYIELRAQIKHRSSGYIRLNKRFIVNKDRIID